MLLDLCLAAALAVAIYLAIKYFNERQPVVKSTKKPLPKVLKPTEDTPSKENGTAEKGKPVKILFGSQSGTAETFAYELAEEAKVIGFNPTVVDLEDYEADSQLADETFVVFLMATFGEGDPTDNAVQFYQWITSPDREPGSITKPAFAVFALGNRQYEHFCNIGRKVDEKMHDMGAQRLVEHGEGDDDGNHMEDDFSKWKEAFWEAAKIHFKIDHAGEGGPVFTPSWTVIFPAQAKEDYKSGHGFLKDPKFRSGFAEVVVNRELRQDPSDGSTFHVDLDVTSVPAIKYQTADNLGIFPRNDSTIAAKFVAMFDVSPDMLFVQKGKKGSDKARFQFPSPCTVLDAFLWYLDIGSTPRIQLLKLLVPYCKEEKDRQQLLHWCSAKGKEEFAHEQLSLYEVFEALPSLRPPIEHFLEMAPKLTPRYYTISSSSRASPTTISITVSLLSSPKPRERMYKGLCTHFLQELQQGSKVCCFVRPSTFRLPKKRSIPIIMVGPGTGIAPFRAMLQEVAILRPVGGEEKRGDVVLYFGCRWKDRDYIYREELEAWASSSVCTHLRVAFSREQMEKVYVQHKIEEDKEHLWNLMDKEKAFIYVCGGTGMGRSVKEAFQKVCQSGGLSEDSAKQYLKRMQDTGRYIQELWS